MLVKAAAGGLAPLPAMPSWPQGLIVGGGMVVALGAGAGDLVQINDSHFGPFTLSALGNAASVQIEAGAADGVGKQFDGPVAMALGANARLYFSPQPRSDPTRFNPSVTIAAAKPAATLHKGRWAIFLHPPI